MFLPIPHTDRVFLTIFLPIPRSAECFRMEPSKQFLTSFYISCTLYMEGWEGMTTITRLCLSFTSWWTEPHKMPTRMCCMWVILPIPDTNRITDNLFYQYLAPTETQQLSNSIAELNTQFFITDYEIAAINAVRTVFPDRIVSGCYFHLLQSFIRKLSDVGLKQEYGKHVYQYLTLSEFY